MTPQNPELAAIDAARAGAVNVGGRASRAHSVPGVRRLRSYVRADPMRLAAVRDSWRALWTSRLLVFAAGVAAAASLGFGSAHGAFDPPHITGGFGWFGDLLAAPVARWDSAWYLVIAHYGYAPGLAPARAAYFPLYPLAIHGLAVTGMPLIVAGVALSLLAFAFALYGIHRLTTLELGVHATPVARLAVLVTAFSPMAFFFSAVYTDALYMALSVGVFWSARHGRWAWAGVLGGLAAATRSTGLMLLVPALLLYLYGPREDRPAAPRMPAARGGARSLAATLRPRYRLRADVLWLALVPGAVALYCAWLALHGGEALGPFHAEQAWSRHFVGPYLGIWDGIVAGFDGVRQLLSFQTAHVYFTLAGGSPTIAAWHNLVELAFLLAAIPAIVGVLRRLPFAYGAYVLAALALPLSYPVAPQPLMSMPRYLVVLFPLSIWLGAWLFEHPRLRRPALALSVALMLLFIAQFATWHWVA